MNNSYLERRNEKNYVCKWHLTGRYLLLLLCGIAANIAFPPYSIHYLAWFILIPLYFLIKDLNWHKAFWGGLIWGYGFIVTSLYFLTEIEFFIPFAVACIMAFFLGIWAIALPVTKKYILLPEKLLNSENYERDKYLKETQFKYKTLLLILFLACWWCIMEWVRSWIFTGLPWTLLATSQFKQLNIIQISSFTGIYGVSFLIVVVNLTIGTCIEYIYKTIKYKKNYTSLPLSFYFSIILIVFTFYCGIYLRGEQKEKTTKDVKLEAGVVQGNIPQSRYYSPELAKRAVNVYSKLSEKILSFSPDILIWPEGAAPQPYRGKGYLSDKYRNNVKGFIEIYSIPVLLGSIDYQKVKESNSDKNIAYNSALFINEKGKIAEKYNKIHLVPWGEYTPGENLFPFKYFYPWIKKKFGMGRSLSPGKEHTIFNIKNGVFASVLICYEDVFPSISREHILAGSNLLLTLTNDAWFPVKQELKQHLAHSVFRAVETRTPMVRVGNCGGTCVIQSDGKISQSIFYSKENGELVPNPTKKNKGAAIFNVNIEKNPELSFYTKYGNLFIFACIKFCLIIFLYILLTWRNKKNELLKIISKDETN